MSDLEYYYNQGRRDKRKVQARLQELEDKLYPADVDEEEADKVYNRFYNPPHRDVSDRTQEEDDQFNAYDEGFYPQS